MIQQEVLQNLFDVRKDLESRLMDLSPAGDQGDTDLFRSLARKRDQVVTKINEIIAEGFKDAVNPEVDSSLKDLAKETESLKALGNSFANVNKVIGVVDQALQIATKVAAAAAGAGL